MALDPMIQCFKDEYDRFAGLMEQQITMCPEAVWMRKAGGWPFWQQIFHTVMLSEFYALAEGLPSAQDRFSPEVVMLSQEPDGCMTKEEMLALSGRMKALVHEFMGGLTVEDLTREHPRLSKVFGRSVSNQFALIGAIRHYCYHLGCCDAILRDNGLKGVY